MCCSHYRRRRLGFLQVRLLDKSSSYHHTALFSACTPLRRCRFTIKIGGSLKAAINWVHNPHSSIHSSTLSSLVAQLVCRPVDRTPMKKLHMWRQNAARVQISNKLTSCCEKLTHYERHKVLYTWNTPEVRMWPGRKCFLRAIDSACKWWLLPCMSLIRLTHCVFSFIFQISFGKGPQVLGPVFSNWNECPEF